MSSHSLSLADLKARAEATQKATGPSFNAPKLGCTVGDIDLDAEPRVFSTGGMGWYGSAKGEVDGVPVRVQINVTIPGSKPAKANK